MLIGEAEARGWGCLRVTADNIKVFRHRAEMCPGADRDFRGPACPPASTSFPCQAVFQASDDPLVVTFVVGGAKRDVGVLLACLTCTPFADCNS